MAMYQYPPGTNPLELLDSVRGYQFRTLTYPLDFDDISSFGHYMNFYINVNKSSKYLGGNGYNTGAYKSDAGESYFSSTYTPAYSAYGWSFPGGAYSLSPGPTPGGSPGEPIPGPSSGIGDLIGGIIGGGGSAGLTTSIPYKRISEAISLYIPDSMNFSSSYDWQDASITEAGGKALKYGQLAGGGYTAATSGDLGGKNMEALQHIGGGALADLMFGAGGAGNGLGDIGLGIAGLAVNPQIFVLFRGVDMRTFQFDFIFTPKSEREAFNVRQIIKAFRFHAAPEVDPYTGRYFIAPSIFNIEYMYAPPPKGGASGVTNIGKKNQNIFQMMTLVLQKLSVDYAPFGWSTYNDGMPIQTHLSMVFKETEILTKTKVNMGY